MKTTNNFTITQKIILSIFPVLSILFLIDTLILYKIPYEYYTKIGVIIFILMIVQNFILIVRVNKKVMDKSLKIVYIVLFLSLSIFHLYYVWVLDRKNNY